MSNRLHWTLGLAGLAVLGVAPWLWWWAPGLLWVAGPLLVAWLLWLVVEYLQWVRGLGK